MKIHAVCAIKNEADIIEETLRAAASWADWIYVLDNGSTDGTWEAVQKLGGELPGVVPYKQDPRPFDFELRGDLLRHYVNRAKRGDWWCILDADEIYVDDPRQFLKAVPRRYKSVYQFQYIYQFTDAELALYERSPADYHATSVDERMRHYVVDEYCEMRFFRHRRGLNGIPEIVHPVYPKRIRLKHFMYRSPEQIAMRLATRREPMERGEWLHEKRENWTIGASVEDLKAGPARADDLEQSWRERVTSSSVCHFDARDGSYADVAVWSPPPGPSLYSVFAAYARRALRAIRRHGRRLLATK